MKAVFATVALLFLSNLAWADDAKPVALKGTYTKDAGEFVLTFAFEKPGELKFSIINGSTEDGLKLTAKYTQKGDAIAAIVEKAEKLGDFPTVPEKGAKMNFKVKLDGKMLTLSDYTGEAEDEARDALEGDYTLTEKKKK
ncbi:hypothetical protein [Tuwongella immobilis]|uniref:Uncharacterized protein n=1 Tax=Tuwongella immobilis TaxID=692036 RepID=A0A6C2YSD8_9BACT|nr:hypothetical protein [Tuwongella immobilis]VIP04281.1 unnamed protein product [Tuwongella immobilis]VTS05925.1 unnamed protein product [Tuwongella immobilis]